MNYWQERERLYNKTLNTATNQLKKEYARCAKSNKNLMVDLYAEILEASKGGTLLVSDLYKYDRYYNLQTNLNKELTKLGLSEIKITEKHLIDLYIKNQSIIGTELSFTPTIDKEKALRTINQVWCADKKAWSNRIWANKSLLQENITNGLMDCISRGVSKDRLITTLMDNFNTSYHNAERIVRTELIRTQNTSTIDAYLEAGIKEYEILDTSDSRCCDSCSEESGKRYPVTNPEHIPPFHPNCRCTVIAVIH